jgi:hypothetical protein
MTESPPIVSVPTDVHELDNKMLLKTHDATKNINCMMGCVTRRTVFYVVMPNTRETDVGVTTNNLLPKADASSSLRDTHRQPSRG